MADTQNNNPFQPPSLIDTLVSRIVEEANPERIILFGSQARGDARPDSDIDVLVISGESFGLQNSRRAALGRLYKALARLPVAKDILLFSRDEIDEWRSSLNHVIGRALREGKVIYERP
ncbi:MAG: nucleotidyltransferase domain-containing protein [Magnetococcales bacterium]|nr:nucleotidyltransferase domain-containing protein [Magnetococcales bacterium]